MAYGKVVQGERDKLVKRIWRTEERSGKKFLTKRTREYTTQELREIDASSRKKYPTKQEKAATKAKELNPRKYFTRKALEAGKRYEKMTGKKIAGGLYRYDEFGRKRIRKAEEILAAIQNAEKLAYKRQKPLTKKELIEGIKKKEPFFDGTGYDTDYLKALYSSYYPQKPKKEKTFIAYGVNQESKNLVNQMSTPYTLSGANSDKECIYGAIMGSVANFSMLYDEFKGNIRSTFEQHYGHISVVDYLGANLYDKVIQLSQEQAKRCAEKLAINPLPQFELTPSDGIYEVLSGKQNPTVQEVVIIFSDWLRVMSEA